MVRRIMEPFAPHTQPFLGEVAVEKRILEGAPIVLTPATRVKKRDSLRVLRYGWPVLDHPKLLPSNGATRSVRLL